MNTTDFLDYLNSGKTVESGSEMHEYMIKLSNNAMKIIEELNTHYHSPEEIRILMSKLINKEVDENFGIFPPFYTDCGRNIILGKNVFINYCCCFQDQGGITIGDNTLIGHNVVLATLNHEFLPERRHCMIPKPIVIGKNVWIGSNATVIGGVTIGDNAVVAAGAVVTKDVTMNTVVGGVPAVVLKSIY